MLVKVKDGVATPYSMWDLKRDNPNVSFPEEMTHNALSLWSVYPCVEGLVPSLGECEQATRLEIALIEGIWTQLFGKEFWPQDQAERFVREKRGTLLKETDWMALSDNTISPEWLAYRQALRDVTTQVGFPYSVSWPTPPA